jgi:hypothetical protein
MGMDESLKRKFRRLYNADLLPVAMVSYQLGDIVEWDGFLKKNLDYEAYSFVDLLKTDQNKKTELITDLANVRVEDAIMQTVTIDNEFDIKGGTDIPNFAVELGLVLGNKRFINFNIDNVKCKVIAKDLKRELKNLIEKAKEEDKRYYRRKLKHLFFIDKLFYAGNVSFELIKATKSEVEAALTKAKIINPQIAVNTQGKITVSFYGKMIIPFAADIESLKDFID